MSPGGSTIGPDGSCHITLQLAFNRTLHAEYGAPASVIAEYHINPLQKRINVTLTWRNKTATRLDEAMTVFNRPLQRPGYGWTMDVLGEWVSPANVTRGGEQYMHAVWSGIRYAASSQTDSSSPQLVIGTLDAAMVCPVLNRAADAKLTPESALQQACFDYSIHPDGPREKQLTDAAIDGLGVNLYNNRMGISGFPLWYPFGFGESYQRLDETTRFRFFIEERY